MKTTKRPSKEDRALSAQIEIESVFYSERLGYFTRQKQISLLPSRKAVNNYLIAHGLTESDVIDLRA